MRIFCLQLLREWINVYSSTKTKRGKMKNVIYKTRSEMEVDLTGGWKDARKLSNKELEIYYNNEFYGGFDGVTYKVRG